MVDSSPDPNVGTEPRGNRGMARYLAIWAASLCLILGAVVVLNVAADPYAVIGTPGVAGLTLQKPAAADWPRVTKAYMVQRQRPVTLIIGNSTADVGFNPTSTVWPDTWRPVFNLAIDGGLPFTHWRYLQHALVSAAPQHVVVSVNFIESMKMPPKRVSAATQSQFDFEPRMRVLANGNPNPDYPRARFQDLVFSTLSFTALADSIETLMNQNASGETYETPQGWNDGGKFRRWARDDGFNSLFTNKDREKIPQYLRWRSYRKLDIEPVFKMVRLARAHGADVEVVIVPNHADGMEALRQIGLDPDYDAWKAAIVDGVAEAASSGVAIWDFSGYSQYTTEALPSPGDHTHRLRWFWEPVHFQPALGDKMIARITGSAAGDRFGVLLTPANVDAQIASYHAGEAAWVASHPNDVARIAALIKAAR